jgi:vitamin B12 transporter
MFIVRFLFVSASVWAASVSGLTSDVTGQPVAQTRIVIVAESTGERWTVTADDAGHYHAPDLRPGRYLVSAAADQLTAPVQSVVLAPDQNRELSLTLDFTRVRTEVNVTASAVPTSADTASRAVDVVRNSDWRARGVATLAEAVQQTSGVRIQTLGGPGGFTRILMRGLRAQDTAVTIDGLRFRDAATTQGDATTFVENLMLANADKVEVLRGSGSALYGSNAVGGVINLVTDSTSDHWHGALTGEGGGLAYGRGLFQLGGPVARNLYFTTGLQHTNVVRGNDGQDPFRNSSLQSGLTWKPTSTTSLTGRLYAGDGFTGLNDSPFVAAASLLPARGTIRAVPVTLAQQRLIEAGQAAQFTNGANLVPNLNDPDQHRASRFAATAFVFTHQAAPRLFYRASYQNVYTRRRFDDGPAGARFEPLFRTEDRSRGRIDTWQARADFAVSPTWQVGAGYEGEREDYQGRSTNAAPTPLHFASSATQHSNALLGYAEGRLLAGRLHVSLAGRTQHFRLAAPRFEGSTSPYRADLFTSPPAAHTFDAGASWFIARTGTKLRAHVGNGYRAPSMFERFGMSSLNGVFAPNGDPRLRPDRTLSLDAGLDQYLWRERVRVSSTAFYTDLREVIAFDSSGFLTPATDVFGRSSGYINTAGGIARGVETQAELALPRRIRLVASYTFANSSQRRSTVRDNDFFRSPLVVPHLFSATLTTPVTRRLDVALTTWITSAHATIISRRAFLFEGAQRVDLAASYALPIEAFALRLQLRASNLLDSRYLENGFRATGRWATAGFTLNF